MIFVNLNRIDLRGCQKRKAKLENKVTTFTTFVQTGSGIPHPLSRVLYKFARNRANPHVM